MDVLAFCLSQFSLFNPVEFFLKIHKTFKTSKQIAPGQIFSSPLGTD